MIGSRVVSAGPRLLSDRLSLISWLTTRLSMLGLAAIWPREANGWSDLLLYANWATATISRVDPVRELAEYPPLAQLTLLAGGLSTDTKIFASFFLLGMALVDLAILRMLLVARRSSGTSTGVVLWILAPALLGSVIWTRYDLVPALFAAAAIRLRAGSVSRGVAVGLGTAFKLWPVVTLPAAVIMSRGRRPMILAAVATTAAGFALPAWLLNASITTPFTWSADRGLHIESVPAAVPLLLSVASDPAEVEFRFGAWQLSGNLADGLATSASVAMIGVVLIVLLVVWMFRKDVQRTPGRDLDLVAQLATVALLAGMLAVSKVLSPQYLVWILAPVAVVLTDHRLVRGRVVASTLALACALTHVVYPLAYDAVLEQHVWAVSLLFSRNLLVVALAVLLFAELNRALRPLPEQDRRGSGERSVDQAALAQVTNAAT